MSGRPGGYDPEGYTLEDGLASVGEGWASLVREIFDKKPANVKIDQVKEKFGGLRVYANNAEFERTVIDPIAERSYEICEWCGKPGTLDTRTFWVITLCEEDKSKREEGYRPWTVTTKE